MKTVPLRSLWQAALAAACLLALTALPVQAQLPSQLYADAVAAYKAGKVAEAKHKLQLTLEIDKNFRPASEMLNRINLAQQQDRASGVTQMSPKVLEQTVFPVEFKETSLQTALEYIRQQAEEKSAGKAQLNFVLQVPPEVANKKITLRLSHVPVSEMLHYIGNLAGVSFEMQRYAIAVVPATAASAAAGSAAATPQP